MPTLKITVPDVSLDLAHAIVATSDVPLLLLDGKLEIVAASEAFCAAFGIDCRTAVGIKVTLLGSGEWDIPQLGSLLKATAAGMAEVRAYELQLKRDGKDTRCLVLNAHKLSYGGEVRVLLAITDVTDARLAEQAKDDLLRGKANLLKELQHRVANSLQIIASVLLQNARNVQSDETRAHLNDAHNRVMSVAALQKQLAASGAEDVALRPYFTQLCESIGASMIPDHDQIKLEVTGDDSQVDANMSVSLGLVVTELVINALKHAFPNDRSGEILVNYSSAGANWTLKVADDGVGMGPASDPPASGLGTSIINALAKQLQARITLSGGAKGTTVSLVHSKLAAVGADGTSMPVVSAV